MKRIVPYAATLRRILLLVLLGYALVHLILIRPICIHHLSSSLERAYQDVAIEEREPLVLLDLFAQKVLLVLLGLWFIFYLPLNGRVSVGAVGVVLVALEFLLQCHGVYLRYRYPQENCEHSLWVYDPLLGWSKEAHQTFVFSNRDNRIRTIVKTNSHGLRDEEMSYQPLENENRVLLIGNSSLAGLEVSKKHHLESQMEKILNKERQDTHISVINGGTRGYGTDQIYLFLKERGVRYKPKVIIYIFTNNDYSDVGFIHRADKRFGKPFFARHDSLGFILAGVPVPRRFEPHDQTLYAPFPEKPYSPPPRPGISAFAKESSSLFESIKGNLAVFKTYRWLRSRLYSSTTLTRALSRVGVIETQQKHDTSLVLSTADPLLEQYYYDVQAFLLQRLQQTADSIGAFFFVYHMTNGSGAVPSLPTTIGRMCDSLRISYKESFQLFNKKAKGGTRFCFPTDGHWNNRGHRLVAEVLCDYIEQSGRL